MTEVSRRTYYRARVLETILLDDIMTLEAGAILESETKPSTIWLIQEPGQPDIRVPVECLEIHRVADIVFQTFTTIVLD